MTRVCYLLALFLVVYVVPLCATHNRAGEITYVQIDDLTIRATITTYTKTSSVPADRDSLLIVWGDGTQEVLVRANGNGTELPNDVKLNFYIGTHTYPSRGTYLVSMRDMNRNGGIRNINFPSDSEEIAFYVETQITLLNPIFSGSNSSATLLQPPLDYACLGQRYVHNPNAFDVDGDSLAYEWTVPNSDRNTQVPNYMFPDEISPGANNQMTLDPITGTIVWDAPQEAGEYNIAFLIKEYRDGFLLNSIRRDMQIIVLDQCDNRPPELTFEEEFCVIAPGLFETNIHADDPDAPDQQIRISATGGPFEVEKSPAQFDFPTTFVDAPIDALFVWQTVCDHVRVTPYQVVFRVEDDFQRSDGLTDLKAMRIQVVAPPPQNLIVEETIEYNEVRWDRPYLCDGDENDYFRGFTVWRKENEDGVNVSDCVTDLAAQGYSIIAAGVLTSTDQQYFYQDRDIVDETMYCYRVTGVIARESSSGQIINPAHSQPSGFACTGIRRDVPFITQSSVVSTSATSGEVEVKWIAPFLEDFDTTIYIPPYRFELLRNDQIIETVDLSSYSDFPKEFIYLDSDINTSTEDHAYTVNLYSNNIQVGTSEEANTIFLSLSNQNDGIQLSWTNDVPWQNDSFQVFKRLPNGSSELIATTRTASFVDNEVIRDSTYCYYVQSFGQYNFIPVDNIINLSQEACLRREFDFPPCDPTISVQANCNFSENVIPTDSFEIFISWVHQDCPDLLEELAGYNVYFMENGSETFELQNAAPIQGDSYVYRSLNGTTGCFRVTAVSINGMESAGDNSDCFTSDESCTFLLLPNAFTPNGDGVNDVFRPISYRFVNSLEINIFNRWGNKVFETTDIEINWDGLDMNGNAVDPGTYFYECRYSYNRESVSNSDNQITGYIEVLK